MMECYSISTAYVTIICKRGHDKRVCGVRPNGQCMECNRLTQRIILQNRPGKHPNYNGNSVSIPTLKKVRLTLGLTQQQLADKCGVSRSLIVKVEHGKKAGELSQWRILDGIQKEITRRKRYTRIVRGEISLRPSSLEGEEV